MLSKKLSSCKKRKDVCVVAIPRGGVIIGAEISSLLAVPLQLLACKKISAPQMEELAIGALAPGGISYIDREITERLGISNRMLGMQKEKTRRLLDERIAVLGTGADVVSYKNWKVFIIADDGIATGATTLAAVKFLKKFGPPEGCRIIVAAPVIAEETYNNLRSEVDQTVVLVIDPDFRAVGSYYRHFPQVSDDEVKEVWIRANHVLG